MSETSYEFPNWINGLIIFLLTPALIFFIVSALIALAIIVALILILNLPMAVWCAITRRPFELWNPVKTNEEKSRER